MDSQPLNPEFRSNPRLAPVIIAILSSLAGEHNLAIIGMMLMI